MNVEVQVLKRVAYQGPAKTHIVWVKADKRPRVPLFTGSEAMCVDFVLALRQALA